LYFIKPIKTKQMENQPIQNQSKETYVNPLTAPANYDLATLLKELKFGRPAESQMLLDKWIAELENELPKTYINGVEVDSNNSSVTTTGVWTPKTN
jgi:hypothetical protein